MSVSIRERILSQFAQAAEEQDKTLATITDELPLMETGLDSLCFAMVVGRLEDELGFDPFSATDVRFPVTVGDFIKFYEHGANTSK